MEKSNLLTTPGIAETFCPLPWTQLSFTPTGEHTACCVSNKFARGVPIEKAFNSAPLRELRKQLASGERPDSCSACWKLEATGNLSFRQEQLSNLLSAEGELGVRLMVDESRHNYYYVSKPSQLDLRLGTACNLQCRMCSAHNSSKAWQEYSNNKELLAPFPEYYGGAETYYLGEHKAPSVDQLIDVSYGVDKIVVSGGEPFLSRTFLEYMEKLIDLGMSKTMRIKISTNAMKMERRFLELTEKFEQSTLCLSIDGTDRIQEYIRHPSTWAQIAKNVEQIKTHYSGLDKDNFSVFVSPTYQALNILDITTLLEWCDHASLNWNFTSKVMSPHYLSVEILPEPIRKLAAERLQRFLKSRKRNAQQVQEIEAAIHHLHTPTEYDPSGLRRFRDFVQAHDKIRNQAFSDYCPELHSLLKSLAPDIFRAGEANAFPVAGRSPMPQGEIKISGMQS